MTTWQATQIIEYIVNKYVYSWSVLLHTLHTSTKFHSNISYERTSSSVTIGDSFPLRIGI